MDNGTYDNDYFMLLVQSIISLRFYNSFIPV